MVETKDKTKFLDDLGGNERELTQPESTTLDKLNEIRDIIIKEYNSRNNYLFLNTFMKEAYEEINNRLDELTSDLKYKEIDLKNFIYANSNLDLGDSAATLGAYSAYLLDKLNLDFFYINGFKNHFDHLFQGSSNCKNLIIESINGFDVGANISNSGLLAFINIKGDQIGTHAANERKTNNVFYINNNGKDIGISVAEFGEASFIAYINNKGEYIGRESGHSAEIDTFLAINNVGINYLRSIIMNGELNNLVLIENKGFNPLEHIGSDGGKIKNAYFIDNDYSTNKNIKNLFIVNSKILENDDKDQSVIKYEKLIKQKNLQNIVKLANNPDQCTGEDFAKYLVKISEEIR
ncbi:hypothetical protein ACFL1H_07140 [Nanoarchaeota archaeon]